jgi:hypothetical protein
MKGSLPILALLWSAAACFAWDLKPDPPAQKAWAVRPNLAIPLTDRNDRVTFADGNGPFVLVGNGKTREVFDLRTGGSVVKFDVTVGDDRTGECLSSDGKTGAFAAPRGTEVKLTDTATGKPLPAVAAAGTIQAVGFVTSDRLLVVGLKGKERVAQVFDTATGNEVLNWPLDAGGFAVPGSATRPFAVSPGGRYVAVIGAKAVTVHALADGTKLADLPLPVVPPAPRLGEGPRGDSDPLTGVAFAADGRELAAVVGKSEKGAGVLTVWTLADGTSVQHAVDRPGNSPGGSAPAISPILSGGWLIDGTEVWVDGNTQRTVPQDRVGSIPRVAVTPKHVVGVVAPHFAVVPKPPVVGRVAAAGEIDGPPKDGLWQGEPRVPHDWRAEWTGPVTAFTPAFEPKPQKLPLPGLAVGLTVSLDGRRTFVECNPTRQTNPTGREVISTDWQTRAGFSFTLPERRTLCGDTTTGEAVLATRPPDAAGNGERLELFTATGKFVVAWRPHPWVPHDPTRSSILYAAALSPSRAITVGDRRVTLWQLPEAKAVWAVEVPHASGGGLSPDGRVLFVLTDGEVLALNVDTGGTVGNLKGNAGGHGGEQMAVSGDGKRLAAVSGQGVAREVRVWELFAGTLQVLQTVPAGGAAGGLRFLSPRFLLVGDAVFDLTDRREVWRVTPPADGVVARSAPADGRVWYVTSTGGTAHLHAAAFPNEQLARFLTDYLRFGTDGVLWRLPGEATLTADGINMNWPAGLEPQTNLAVEGDPSLDSPPPARQSEGLAAGLGVGLVIAVVVLLAVRWWRRRAATARERVR